MYYFGLPPGQLEDTARIESRGQNFPIPADLPNSNAEVLGKVTVYHIASRKYTRWPI